MQPFSNPLCSTPPDFIIVQMQMDDLHIRIRLQKVLQRFGNNPFPFDDIDTS